MMLLRPHQNLGLILSRIRSKVRWVVMIWTGVAGVRRSRLDRHHGPGIGGAAVAISLSRALRTVRSTVGTLALGAVGACPTWARSVRATGLCDVPLPAASICLLERWRWWRPRPLEWSLALWAGWLGVSSTLAALNFTLLFDRPFKFFATQSGLLVESHAPARPWLLLTLLLAGSRLLLLLLAGPLLLLQLFLARLRPRPVRSRSGSRTSSWSLLASLGGFGFVPGITFLIGRLLSVREIPTNLDILARGFRGRKVWVIGRVGRQSQRSIHEILSSDAGFVDCRSEQFRRITGPNTKCSFSQPLGHGLLNVRILVHGSTISHQTAPLGSFLGVAHHNTATTNGLGALDVRFWHIRVWSVNDHGHVESLVLVEISPVDQGGFPSIEGAQCEVWI